MKSKDTLIFNFKFLEMVNSLVNITNFPLFIFFISNSASSNEAPRVDYLQKKSYISLIYSSFYSSVNCFEMVNFLLDSDVS